MNSKLIHMLKNASYLTWRQIFFYSVRNALKSKIFTCEYCEECESPNHAKCQPGRQ